MSAKKPIRPRTRDAILQSLRAGVVPRVGLEHIQVGRAREIAALLTDLERVADGGSSVRFVIGEYGSGKTFFLHLVRAIALEKRLVCVQADLSPERRLQASGGQARALYAELMRSMSTRNRPEGGALASVVESFVTTATQAAKERGTRPELVIQERLAELSELVGGYDFAQVIEAYWRAHETHNDELAADAVRWLRAEFATRTDARAALDVRTIVDDQGFFEHLKLMARFVRLAGYQGLFVCLDEMVNLYKLASTRARNANYERLLGILNESLQGEAAGLCFLFGGTPEFLSDTRRGLFSYPALQSRLAENTFARPGLVDLSGPVLRLASLTAEELYVLLANIRNVEAGGEPERQRVPDEALTAFMEHCSKVIGDAYFRTPRSTVKSFVDLLSVLEQNPGTDWRELLGRVRIERETNPDLAPLEPDDEAEEPPPAGDDDLASFKL